MPLLSDDEFNAAIAQQDEQQRQARAATVYHGVQTPPQAAAKAVKVGDTLGLPPGVVLLDPEQNELLAKAKNVQDSTADSPVLQRWMAAHPINTSLAQDDTHNLRGIEHSLAADTWAGIQHTGLKLLGAWDKAAVALSDLMPDGTPGKMSNEDRDYFTNRGTFMQQRALLPEFTPQRWSGQVASGLSYAPFSGAAPFVMAGTEGSATAQQLKDQGVDESTANKAGALSGGITGLSMFVPMGNLVWGEGLGALARSTLGASLKAGAVGAGQSVVSDTITSKLLGDSGYSQLADQYAPTVEKAWENALFMAGMHLGMQGVNRVIGGAPMPRQPVQETLDAAKAEQDFNTFQNLSALSQASQLREHAPDKFKEYMQNVTEDGQLANVYIDAHQLAEALDKNGVTADHLRDTMPEVAGQMKEALETNGLVRIPTADYATHIAGSKADADILPLLKTDPDGKTYAEAQDYFQKQAEQMKEQAVQLAQDKQQQAQLREQHDELVKTIQAQHNELGRFSPEVNKVNAQVQASILTRIAQREGITPQEAFDKYGPVLKGEGQGGLDEVQQDVPHPTDTPEFKNWFGESKVVDAEGKPLVVYHGTNYVDAKGDALTEFKPGTGMLGDGIYLTPKADAAGLYPKMQNIKLKRDGKEEGPISVMPVFASMQNPLVLDALPVGKIDAEHVKAQGYDGIILKGENGSIKEMTVFDPTQIKSAIGNRGTFDPNDPNILHQDSGYKGAPLANWKPDESLIADAKKFFGTTQRPLEAGYILPDGTMLDFTGRHETSKDNWPYMRDQRSVDHRMLTGENMSGFSLDSHFESRNGSELMHEFMAKTGAMRVDFNSGVASALRPPTPEQVRVLGRNIGKDYAALSYVDGESGRIIADKEWDNISPAKVKMFFDENRDKTPDPRAPLFQNDLAPRGSYNPATRTISLLKDANLSTFLHETGHWALDTYAKIAAHPEGAPEIKADMDKLLQWFGVESLEKWNSMTLDEQRPYHEQLARSFEKYLFEGKAPSLELAPVFQRIKAWMLHVYKTLRNPEIDMPLTDEVRGVFDRMLASEDAIREAESIRNFTLPKEKPESLSEAEWADLQKAHDEATQDAIDIMQTKSLRDMKWLSNARSKALKELQAQAASERDRIMGEVQDQVLNSPMRKAEEFMEAHPDADREAVAEQFGFASAKELQNALASAGTTRQEIDGLTDRRMLEEHGELSSPEAIEQAANEAIHNAARERFAATALRVLAKSPVSSTKLLKGAKEAAEAAIGAKKVGEVNPRQYLAAESKANREMVENAAKDPQKAVEAQRAALLNNQLVKAAYDAKDLVRKALDYAKSFDKTSKRLKISPEERDMIDDLLARFDFRQVPKDDTAKQRLQLTQWVESQKALGYTPLEVDDMLNPSVRMHYKDMTVDQLRGLMDTIKSIEKIGRDRNLVGVEGQKLDLRELVDTQLIPKMQARGEKFTDAQLAERPRYGVDPAWRVTWDRIGSVLRRGVSEALQPDKKGNKWDLHELLGPFQRSIVERLITSAYKYGDMLDSLSRSKKEGMATYGLDREWQKSLDDVVDNHALLDNSLENPTKRRLTRGDLIGIAMHVGNESNFDKLVQGMRWEPASIWQALHDNMREKDWRAAQLLGELAGAKWDEMAAMNRRLGNDNPAKIEPRPFQTKFGEMPGWYAPINYDPIRSRLGVKRAEASAVNPSEGLFGRDYYRADTTTNGSLNARASGYYDFIDLGWRPIEKRISDTLRDLAYREALIDVHKIYSDKEFRRQFQRTYGPEEYKHLGDWLGRLVNAEVGDERQSQLTSIIAASRRAMVANGVAFRISTMLKHGGSAAFKSTGYMAGGGEKYFAARLASMSTNYGNEVAEALAKSPEIRNRLRQQDRDYGRAVTSIFEPESIHGKAERFGHAGVAWLDFLTAVPTFHAAYDWAITEGIPKRLGGTGKPMSEADAIQFADKIVREAHGSTNEASQSLLVNNKSELVKSLTILHGFMNNAFGQNVDAIDKAFHAEGFGKPELLARVLFAQIVPALAAGWVTFGGPNEDETYLGWALHHIGGEFAGMVPMLREGWSAVVEGRDSAGLPPWIRSLTDIYKAGKSIVTEASGDDAKHPIKDVGNAAGLFLPGLGQLGASSQFLYDYFTGDQRPETVGEWIRGVMSGRTEPAK